MILDPDGGVRTRVGGLQGAETRSVAQGFFQILVSRRIDPGIIAIGRRQSFGLGNPGTTR